MRLVSKWVTDAQDRGIARFLSQPEDFFYGEGLDGLNVGPGVVAFGDTFEDPNVWLQWIGGGLHYVRDGIDQGELGSGGGGAATFLDLLDTPGSYAGANGNFVRVNPAADGLEFADVANPVPDPINIGDMVYSGDGSTWSVRAIGLEGEVLTVGDIGAGDLGPVWTTSSVEWDDVNGKPVEFPPSAHAPTHELGGVDVVTIDWTQLDNVPADFNPSPHAGTHELGGSDELQIDYSQLLNTPVLVTAFLDLLDTPASYDNAGFSVVVNATLDGLEFVNLTPGSGGELPEGVNANDALRWNGAAWVVAGDVEIGASWVGAGLATAGPLPAAGSFRLRRLGTLTGADDTGIQSMVAWRRNGDIVPGRGLIELAPGDRCDVTMGSAVGGMAFYTNDQLAVTTQPNGVTAVQALEALNLGINLTEPPGAGTTFLSLLDTPALYAGAAGQQVVVTAGEDGLEFLPREGGGGGATVAEYRFDTGVVPGDPGSGRVAINDVDPALATIVSVSSMDDAGAGSVVWGALRINDAIVLQDNNSIDGYSYVLTGPVTSFGDHFEMPVVSVQVVGSLTNNELLNLTAIFIGANEFTELLDTPDDYIGQAGLYSRVNPGEDALVFNAVDYGDLTGVPATFPPSLHAASHGDGGADEIAIDWSQITTGVPATFPPSPHTHPFTEITGEIADAQVPESAVVQHEAALDIQWSQLLSVPAEFPPEDHTHPFLEITGQLDNGQVTEANVTQHEAALGIDWTQLSGVPATFPPDPHTHTVSEITDFPVLVTAFPDLSDTPGVLGDPGQVVVVNGIGDALDFATYTPPAVGFNYIYTPPGTGDPAAGELEFNHADPTLATECAVNEIDDGGNFVGAYFPFIQEDDWFILVGATAAGGASFIAAGQAVFDSGVWTIPIQGSVNDEGLTLGLQYRASAQRPVSGIVEWDDIVGKPAEFPPSPHTHDTSDIITGILGFERGGTGLGAAGDLGNVLRSTGVAWESAPLDFTDLSGVAANAQIPVGAVTQHQAALAIDWAQLVGTQPPPIAHDQAFTTITGANADAQVVASNVVQHQAALSIGWAQLTGVPATFPPSAHAASHLLAGADEVFPQRLWNEDFTNYVWLNANAIRIERGDGLSDTRVQAQRFYGGAETEGNNWSGLFQSQASSWPTAQAGWARIYASSGGNGFKVTYNDGRQETFQTSAFADEEDSVAETPADYLMQEVFNLRDIVTILAQALSDAAIPLPAALPADPYAVQSARPRLPLDGTAIP